MEVHSPATPTRGDWPLLLQELGRQLDDGRVYDRDLRKLATALNAALEAYSRRPYGRSQGVGAKVRRGMTSLQPALEVTFFVKTTEKLTGPG
jgi:hypothetical protein